MKHKQAYLRWGLGLFSLAVFSTLFHIHTWWSYAAIEAYALLLALLFPVGSARFWPSEKKMWQTFAGFWGFLMVVCPMMSAFFPDKPYQSFSLLENLSRMGSFIAFGSAVLMAMIIVAYRRMLNASQENSKIATAD